MQKEYYMYIILTVIICIQNQMLHGQAGELRILPIFFPSAICIKLTNILKKVEDLLRA